MREMPISAVMQIAAVISAIPIDSPEAATTVLCERRLIIITLLGMSQIITARILGGSQLLATMIYLLGVSE